MRRFVHLYAATSALIGVPAAAFARATPPPGVHAHASDELFPLVVPVLDVDAPVGTIAIRANQAGDFFVSKASLLPVLERIAGKARTAELVAKLPATDDINAADATAAGFTLRFDTRRVALVIELPAGDRQVTELAVSNTPQAPEPSEARLVPSEFSAYNNFIFAYQNDPALGRGGDLGTIEMDSSANFHGFVLENQAFVEFGGGRSQTLSRSATRLTKDFPAQNIRASLGDIFTTSRGFIQSHDIVGLSVFKDTEVFDPFVSSRPTGRQSFQLERSADVNIYVNDQLVRQVRLGPGSYDLTNFAQLDGANGVRIETRDDLGQTHSYDFTSFFNSDLLAPNLNQWEFDAGFESARFDRQLHYDFGEPVVSGFYRRGISEALTLGASAQIRKDQSILGVEMVGTSGIGNFSIDAAGGYTNPGVGGALALTWRPNLPASLASPTRTLDLFAELTSAGFGENPFNGLDESARFGVRYADLVLHERMAIAAALTYTASAHARSRGITASLSFGYAFRNGIVVRVTPQYQRTLDGRHSAAILLSLSKPFGRKSRARATYDSRENRVLGEYDYVSQFGGIGTVGANVVASRADHDPGTITANGSYIGNRFEANLGYSQLVEGNRAFDRGRTNVVVQTSLAYAGGHMAIGRPINDSFAVVTKHPSIGDRQVVVEPAVNDRGDDARSGALGNALIPDLSSYSISKLSYAVNDLPPGFDIGSGVFEFFPPYHAGYVAQVGSNRIASAVGFVKFADGKPVATARGTLTSPDDKDFGEHTIFTNRAGRFGLLGLIPGKTYVATFPDSGVSFKVAVPADADGFVDVGVVTSDGKAANDGK